MKQEILCWVTLRKACNYFRIGLKHKTTLLFWYWCIKCERQAFHKANYLYPDVSSLCPENSLPITCVMWKWPIFHKTFVESTSGLVACLDYQPVRSKSVGNFSNQLTEVQTTEYNWVRLIRVHLSLWSCFLPGGTDTLLWWLTCRHPCSSTSKKYIVYADWYRCTSVNFTAGVHLIPWVHPSSVLVPNTCFYPNVLLSVHDPIDYMRCSLSTSESM